MLLLSWLLVIANATLTKAQTPTTAKNTNKCTYLLYFKTLFFATPLLHLLTESCGWPTAEGLTILLPVFLLGCGICLPGFGRCR